MYMNLDNRTLSHRYPIIFFCPVATKVAELPWRPLPPVEGLH